MYMTEQLFHNIRKRMGMPLFVAVMLFILLILMLAFAKAL